MLGVLAPCSRLNVQERVSDRAVATEYRANVPMTIRIRGGVPNQGNFIHNPNYRRDLDGLSIAARPLPTTGSGLRALQNPQAVEDRGVANLLATSPVQYLVWGDTPYFTTWLRYTQTNNVSVVFALQGVNFSRVTAGDYRVQLVCATADCRVVEGLDGGTPRSNYGISFPDGVTSLTIGDYGAKITAADFSGSRELYGFFTKRDGQYVPIYAR